MDEFDSWESCEESDYEMGRLGGSDEDAPALVPISKPSKNEFES